MASEKQMIPEKKIEDFVSRLRAAAGTNLESVILFGSAVAGDFHPEFSNVNLFCVLRHTSFNALQVLAPAVKWWDGQKQPPPLFMTREELERSTDVFTIELIDMQQHHRVIFGTDVLQGLSIPADLHRLQVEYELREKLALLRQHSVLASGNDSRLWEVLLRSVSSFATLFRHALIVLGHPAPLGKREAVQALSKQIAFDASGILQVLDVRERKSNRKNFDVAAVLSRYLAALEQVTAAVDRMLDSGNAGSSK
jgi:Nucleotidyltransferase domain